ncbi:hypothetical protein [Vibrio natriegens]|uniref:hypothetical protein n=1 Tax=Vibrio natriegens TaxID=691 RepID=UPI0008047501|nr:hypothetical protein [Vibrio natriegens]ANQ17086.1 hypothetical protein BA891_07570 [Vibrio natriegens]
MLDFTCGATHHHYDPNLFGRCTFLDLVNLAYRPQDLIHIPLAEDGTTRTVKKYTAWFSPSNCPTKRLEDMKKHGNYCLLIVDVDKLNPRPENIANEFRQLEIESFLIYDTVSSTETDRRYRVVIELARSVGVDKWEALQRTLVSLFDSDKCTLKPAQISYMPTLSICNKNCYAVTYSSGHPVDPDRSKLALEAKAFECVQEEKQAKAPKRYTSPPPTFDFSIDEQRNPIDVFNQVATWDWVLDTCGFKKVGSRLLPPTSNSGVPGAIISYKIRPQGAYFSFHTSDPLSDGLPHDKFDVWMVHGRGFDHQNPSDVTKASIEFARQYRLPDGHTLEKKNQYVHITQNKKTRQH